MVGRHSNKQGGDEYQYPDEEYMHADADAGADPDAQADAQTEYVDDEDQDNRFSSISENPLVQLIKRNQRVAFVVGFVIVILIAFKIMGSHQNQQLQAQQQRAAEAQQHTLEQAANAAKQLNPQISSALASVKQAESSDRSSINELQSQMKDLHAAMDQMTGTQTQLNQAVVALAEQVKQLNSKLDTSAPKTSAKTKQAALQKPVVYHIKAVVEGRAWIVSSDGMSQSVIVGDSVPEYGKVKTINADQGLITTSSGKVIRYGENDR